MTTSQAAYERVTASSPVRVVNIYANEYGSPFVRFDGVVNAACSASTGLYLYNLQEPNNAQLRNNKMALLLTALAANRPVVLDYFYDVTKAGGNWDACFIHGLYLY
jgi:hypothetical protein